jgi:TonB family protein
MDTVADILVSRAPEPAGLRRMFIISMIAHVFLSVAFLLMPSPAPDEESERSLMTISLGGAPGPSVGGMTAMGGRAVQAPAPETKRAPVAPPAPKTPEMTLPTPSKQAPRPAVREAPDNAKSRTPVTGPEPREGSAKVETGGRGISTGLTLGGGGTGGSVDLANFCCPEYLGTMVQLIQRNWNARQQVAGRTVVKFTIERDGRISSMAVEQSSGYFALDQTAQRAILLTRQLPALPPQYTEDQLTIHLVFRYER